MSVSKATFSASRSQRTFSIAHPQWQSFFAFKLVRQGIVFDHELGMLAGRARQALVKLQRRQAFLGALLIDEREQALFAGGIDLFLRVSA